MLAQRSFRHKKGQLNTVSSIMLLGYVCVATFLVLSSEHSLGCRHTEGPLSALATRLNQPNSSRLMAHVEHNAYPRDRLALPVGIDGPPGIGEGMTPAGWIGLRPHMAAAVVTRTGVLAYPATLTPTTTPTATPTETPTPTPLVACARALWPPGIGEDTATAGWRRPWSRVMAAVVARTGILAWPATPPTPTPTPTPTTTETPTQAPLVACARALWPPGIGEDTATAGWRRPWSRVMAAVVARTGVLAWTATVTLTPPPPTPTETPLDAPTPLVACARALWPSDVDIATSSPAIARGGSWLRVVAALAARTGIPASPSPVEATLLNTNDDTYNAAGGSVQQHVRHGAGRDPAL